MRYLFIIAALLLLTISDVAYAQKITVIRDTEIEQDLKAMSRNIFIRAEVNPDAVRFILLDSPDLNAFVMGGQNIFLHTGLILKTDTPAELYGVIAHETGHIALGHLLRAEGEVAGLTKQAWLANLLGLAVAIGARAPEAGVAISSFGSSISDRQYLRHNRTQEGSADQAGVRFLKDSGLSIAGFLSFMQKLESQELLPETQQSEYIRTHPLTQDRVDFLKMAVAQNPNGATPADWVTLHQNMKAKLLGYLYPDRALLLKEDTPANQYARAIAWFRKGQMDKSLALLDPLIAASPSNPYLQELKGQILFENGRVDQSVGYYKTAIMLAEKQGNKNIPLMRIAYAHSLLEAKKDTANNLNEAAIQLQEALQDESELSEAHFLLGLAYGRLGSEGMSRLHLAENNLLLRKYAFAKREAIIAKDRLKKDTPAYQRVLDILDMLDQIDKKDKNRNSAE